MPVHDDRTHFEFLLLEGAQAGLSWRTILARRRGYARAFAGFDPDAVARFGTRAIERLLRDPGIVRHRGKIEAAVANARAFRQIQREFGSFDAFVLSSVSTVRSPRQRRAVIPAETPASRALSRLLRARGFRFVGPTIVYSYMQAVGLVNDHELGCDRRRVLGDPERVSGRRGRRSSESTARRTRRLSRRSR